jgi:hypothetical protein
MDMWTGLIWFRIESNDQVSVMTVLNIIIVCYRIIGVKTEIVIMSYFNSFLYNSM